MNQSVNEAMVIGNVGGSPVSNDIQMIGTSFFVCIFDDVSPTNNCVLLHRLGVTDYFSSLGCCCIVSSCFKPFQGEVESDCRQR